MARKDAAPLLQWDVGSGVISVAVSNDSTRVASGSRDGLVHIWDMHNGTPIFGALEGHTDWVQSIAWSHDDKHLISGSNDQTIRIWNTRTGAPVCEPLRGHTDWVWSVAFSHDSTRIVSGSEDDTIRIWNTSTGVAIGGPLRGHTASVHSAVFSHDSAHIASGSWDNMVRMWNAHTGTPIGDPLRGHTGAVMSVRYSHDSTHLVSGSFDKTIRIWDTRTGALIGEPLRGHALCVWSMAFSHDDIMLASGSEDKTIRIWGAHTGAPIGEALERHSDSVWSVVFSPDSTNIISGSTDGTICVWKAPQSTPLFDMVTSDMSAEEIFDCLVRHGCKDLSSSLDSTPKSLAPVASGGFGDVWHITLSSGSMVAVKTLRLQTLQRGEGKGVKRAAREVHHWSRLRHPNVQELLGVVIFRGSLGMVSPWLEHGNLPAYINKHPEVERYPLCIQLAAGVSYLHGVGLVHGDLKAANVLMSDDGVLKINDFDFALLLDGSLRFSLTTRQVGGTLRWMAPELFEAEGEEGEGDEAENESRVGRSKQTDIYALGMTMLEIFTGTVPFAEYRTEAGVVRAILKKQIPRRPSQLSGSDATAGHVWNILVKCWSYDAATRPDAATVWRLLVSREGDTYDAARVGSSTSDTSTPTPPSRPSGVHEQQRSTGARFVIAGLSVQEVFEFLVQQGCRDLSSSFPASGGGLLPITNGGFGDVWRITTSSGSMVAVKTLRFQNLLKDDRKGAKRIACEVYHWSKLRHSNVQELLGIVVFQGGLGMVSPWLKYGNLPAYRAKYPKAERYPQCVQLAAGVSYLHGVELVHGDLKAANVLVSDDGMLKINDFDCALLLDSSLRFSTTARPGGGTLRWMAPELYEAEDEGAEGEFRVQRNKRTDIYALGMTMLEIFTGTVPFAECRTDAGVCSAILKKQIPRRPSQLSGPDKTAQHVWNILVKCWSYDAVTRPTAATVLQLLNSREEVAHESAGAN